MSESHLLVPCLAANTDTKMDTPDKQLTIHGQVRAASFLLSLISLLCFLLSPPPPSQRDRRETKAKESAHRPFRPDEWSTVSFVLPHQHSSLSATCETRTFSLISHLSPVLSKAPHSRCPRKTSTASSQTCKGPTFALSAGMLSSRELSLSS